MASEEQERVVVGRVAGVFGVQGWVRIYSYTAPPENVLEYTPWQARIGGRWVELKPVAGRVHGKGIVAQVDGYCDRDAAATLVGTDIAIWRTQLPAAGQGEFYWADLIGLKVVNQDGVDFGVVDHLLETGANDVLVVQGERERLIPYIDQAVTAVDLEQGLIRVNWDPEF